MSRVEVKKSWIDVSQNFLLSKKSFLFRLRYAFTALKVSKYGVFSGPHFPVLGLNTKIYGVNPIQENTDQRKLRIWTLLSQCFERIQKDYRKVSKINIFFYISFIQIYRKKHLIMEVLKNSWSDISKNVHSKVLYLSSYSRKVYKINQIGLSHKEFWTSIWNTSEKLFWNWCQTNWYSIFDSFSLAQLPRQLMARLQSSHLPSWIPGTTLPHHNCSSNGNKHLWKSNTKRIYYCWSKWSNRKGKITQKLTIK